MVRSSILDFFPSTNKRATAQKFQNGYNINCNRHCHARMMEMQLRTYQNAYSLCSVMKPLLYLSLPKR